MKKKIQDALELAYKDKLGLTDKKAYARVASLGETYVAKEEDIPAFVEKAEDLLKGLQGAADQGRTLETANAKIAELEEKLKKLETPDPDPDKDKDKDKDGEKDVAKIVADAIAAAMKPFSEKIENLEKVNSTKAALDGAREKFFGGDYAKKYKDEADSAWERAVEINEVTGNKMTAEELATKATAYFNSAVSKKGVDMTKPLISDSEGDDKDGTLDWAAERKRQQEAGRIPKDN